MTEDRRTKQHPTPGEDPREIDRERTTDAAVDEIDAQEGLAHPQRATGGLGISSDAPGRDLDELADAPDFPDARDQS